MTEPDNRSHAPFEHYCEVCGEWGAFGYGVALRHGRIGRWYCFKHRPATPKQSHDRHVSDDEHWGDRGSDSRAGK
jgi:hypothetical protein